MRRKADTEKVAILPTYYCRLCRTDIKPPEGGLGPSVCECTASMVDFGEIVTRKRGPIDARMPGESATAGEAAQ